MRRDPGAARPSPGEVARALAGLVLRLVAVPVLVCTAGYWVTRLLLQWRAMDSSHASGWAWIVVAVLAFASMATGGGSAITRAGEWRVRSGSGRIRSYDDPRH